MSCEDDYIHQQTNNNLRELCKKSTQDMRVASMRACARIETMKRQKRQEIVRGGIIERTLNARKSSEPSRVKMSQKQS